MSLLSWIGCKQACPHVRWLKVAETVVPPATVKGLNPFVETPHLLAVLKHAAGSTTVFERCEACGESRATTLPGSPVKCTNG
jgi:hypothetical protein